MQARLEPFIRRLGRAVLVVLALVATPALALDTGNLGQGGTLFLSDIMPLIDRTPKLKDEVDAALAAAKKKPDDLLCDGMRFPAQWVNIGGTRVSPYTCDFGGKWLVIKTTVRVTGRSRQLYDAITPAAMKNAVKVSEVNPAWTWTTEDPHPD